MTDERLSLEDLSHIRECPDGSYEAKLLAECFALRREMDLLRNDYNQARHYAEERKRILDRLIDGPLSERCKP